MLLRPTVPVGNHVAHVAHEDRVVGQVDEVGPLPQSLFNSRAFGDFGLQPFINLLEVCGSIANLLFHLGMGLPKRFFGVASGGA